jgi:lipoprotein NlpI
MSDPAAPTQPPTQPPIVMVVLLVFGILLYAGMIGTIADLGSGDAAGRAIGEAFGVIFGFCLWILLAVMIVVAGLTGKMPVWAGIAAAILLPASAVASAIAVEFVKYRSGWQIFVPALIPPLIAAYAFWARLPQLHRVLPPVLTGIAVWGGVLALTLAPMPDYVGQRVAAARLQAAAKVESEAKLTAEEQRRRDTLARFQQLTEASPLWEWAAFIGKDSELDKQAVAGARKLSHRQVDAEEGLRRGMGFPLVEYVRLDLQVTPGLCEGARDFLQQAATSHPSPGGDPYAAYEVIHQNFSPYLEAVEWLTAHDCDIEDAVVRIAAAAAAYPASSSRDGFLGVLAWRQGNGFYERNLYDRALAAYGEAIGKIPDQAQFFDSRGNVYYDMEAYDRAIADYSEAIRLNKGYSVACDSRANAYNRNGDNDRAMTDYDEAIRLNPEFALALNNRGALYAELGDHAKAIADFDTALRLAPKFRVALFNRGRTKFYAGDYPGAAADLSAASALKPTEPYTLLWLYLARARAGQPAQDPLRAEVATLDRSAWPWPVLAAFLGEADTAAALADVRSGDATAKTGRECEADFYLGAKAVIDGDPAAARDLLTKATAACPRSYIEAPGARFELARLPQ